MFLRVCWSQSLRKDARTQVEGGADPREYASTAEAQQMRPEPFLSPFRHETLCFFSVSLSLSLSVRLCLSVDQSLCVLRPPADLQGALLQLLGRQHEGKDMGVFHEMHVSVCGVSLC